METSHLGHGRIKVLPIDASRVEAFIEEDEKQGPEYLESVYDSKIMAFDQITNGVSLKILM